MLWKYCDIQNNSHAFFDVVKILVDILTFPKFINLLKDKLNLFILADKL